MPAEKVKTSIDRETLAQRLRAIGAVDLQIEDIETRMQTQIDRIKERYSDDLHRLRDERESLATALTLQAQQSRDILLDGQRGKTVKTLFGKLQYRAQPVTVTTRRGVKTDDAIALLKKLDLADYVRVKEELDKAELNAAARTGQISEQQLESAGLRKTGGGEDVLIEIDRDSVREHLDQ
ncbi:MAG: host-nuclease inhibitor Gam family protein [Planctomycetota bacterium]